MLVEFRVKNFKNFKDELIFRLDQVKQYEFSTEAIRDGVVKTGLVYGANGSGKSNLGLAMLDISANLTDKEKNPRYNNRPFINLSSKGNAQFYYKFKFDSSYLEYRYEKDNPQHLIEEELKIDDKTVIYYNHKEQKGEVLLKGAETLTTDLNEKNISFIKFIKGNAVLSESKENSIFEQFIDFVENMLLFSSLERNHYQGFRNGSGSIAEGIINEGKLKDFEKFLRTAGITYKLIEKEIDGQKNIFCRFKEKDVNFYSIASRGTCSLALFYYWLIDLDKVSLVFIDEFDSFYHNDLARKVVQEVLNRDVQAIITTHNTSIMDNDLLRPDCYFNIVDGTIKAFAYKTSKELRKAHNIEKMYRAGSFDE